MAVYVSDLRGRALVDPYARPMGRLDDLVAAPVGTDPPLVRGLLVRCRRDTVFLPIDAVALLDAPSPAWSWWPRPPRSVPSGVGTMCCWGGRWWAVR